MLVAPDGRVIHLSDRAGQYLQHSGGEATLNVFRLARAELRVELHAALHEARESGAATRSLPIVVTLNGEPMPVVVDVRPARDPRTGSEEPQPGEGDNRTANGRAQQMEAHLGQTERRLQELIDDRCRGSAPMKMIRTSRPTITRPPAPGSGRRPATT